MKPSSPQPSNVETAIMEHLSTPATADGEANPGPDRRALGRGNPLETPSRKSSIKKTRKARPPPGADNTEGTKGTDGTEGQREESPEAEALVGTLPELDDIFPKSTGSWALDADLMLEQRVKKKKRKSKQKEKITSSRSPSPEGQIPTEEADEPATAETTDYGEQTPATLEPDEGDEVRSVPGLIAKDDETNTNRRQSQTGEASTGLPILTVTSTGPAKRKARAVTIGAKNKPALKRSRSNLRTPAEEAQAENLSRVDNDALIFADDRFEDGTWITIRVQEADVGRTALAQRREGIDDVQDDTITDMDVTSALISQYVELEYNVMDCWQGTPSAWYAQLSDDVLADEVNGMTLIVAKASQPMLIEAFNNRRQKVYVMRKAERLRAALESSNQLVEGLLQHAELKDKKFWVGEGKPNGIRNGRFVLIFEQAPIWKHFMYIDPRVKVRREGEAAPMKARVGAMDHSRKTCELCDQRGHLVNKCEWLVELPCNIEDDRLLKTRPS